MLRTNYRRLAHQFMKEPMGNEENTFSRAQRTRRNVLKHINGLYLYTGAGCLCALYSFISAHNRVYSCVVADGKMGQSTCPTAWWNF
ncbi:unnamed protein product [Phytomonas sp. EM1]|nr:unnamed protein product [Phytomonas sp. EM1]|eukprot:CCW64795.1 unnamed protein product [Phytomonas sp. isolate EM1]